MKATRQADTRFVLIIFFGSQIKKIWKTFSNRILNKKNDSSSTGIDPSSNRRGATWCLVMHFVYAGWSTMMMTIFGIFTTNFTIWHEIFKINLPTILGPSLLIVDNYSKSKWSKNKFDYATRETIISKKRSLMSVKRMIKRSNNEVSNDWLKRNVQNKSGTIINLSFICSQIR